jgi:mRNA interferase RelE/StbE
MSYSIFIEKSAQKSLSRIVPPFQDRIIRAIHGLATAPRPTGVKKLSGRDAWRIRIGDYRVVYEIHDDRLVVLVVAMGHRWGIYR